MLIVFNPSIPEALLPLVEERLASVAHLLPNWCRKLVVEYERENDDDATLRCRSEYHYRFIEICLFDLFFSDEEWKISLIHEIIHGIEAPFSAEAWKLIRLLDIPPDIKSYIENNLRDAEEAVTEDLCTFAYKLVHETPDLTSS